MRQLKISGKKVATRPEQVRSAMLAPNRARMCGRNAAARPETAPVPAGRAGVAGNTSQVAAATANAQTAIIMLTPRQPTKLPIQLAAGTPSNRASDWPLITQPIARPRIESATRSATSPNTVAI